jgi:hypothetical protein
MRKSRVGTCSTTRLRFLPGRMMTAFDSLAELFADGAVYRRTTLGQRELLRRFDDASNAALRLLARFNGFTDIRQLVELAPDDAREMASVLPDLLRQGWIEPVRSEAAEFEAKI